MTSFQTDDEAVIPVYSENVQKVSKTLIHFMLFDRDVFAQFYVGTAQIQHLIETLYLPLMADYFTAYADSLNQIDPKFWSQSAIWTQTIRGRGVFLLSEFLTSVFNIYTVISDFLGLKQRGNDSNSIMNRAAETDNFAGSNAVESWYDAQCSKLDLRPLKPLIRDQLRKICIADNEEQIVTPTYDSTSGEKVASRSVLLRKLCILLEAIMPLCLQKVSFTPKPELRPESTTSTLGIKSSSNKLSPSKIWLASKIGTDDNKPIKEIITSQFASTLKHLTWRAKESIESVSDTFLTEDLIFFNNGFSKLKSTIEKCANFVNQKWISAQLSDVTQVIRMSEELYIEQTLREFDVIFTCYESRNFEFPKKYFTISQPSPMMRLFNKKLVVLGFELS